MNQEFNQNISSIVHTIRYKLQKPEFLRYTYLIFLAGFFFSPDNHLHRNYFYLFVIVPFLIGLDSSFIRNCIRSTLFQLSILFLLYFWASMFWTDTNLSSENYYDLSRYLLMLVIFIMVTMMLSSISEENFDKMKFWLCSAACISAIIMVLIFYDSKNFPRARLTGYFEHTQNPNQASMYFGFIGILAFHSILCAKYAWQKIFYWFVYLTLFVYILLCQSRGPLLAFIIVLVMESIFAKNWKMIALFLTLFIVFMVLLEFYDLGIRSFYERGLSYRLTLWKGAIKHISEAPLFGKGWFADVNIQIEKKMLTAHNLLLLVSAKGGIIGGGLLLLLILTTFMHSYKYFVDSGNWSMTFDYTHILYKPNLGWIIFWMPIALIAGEEIRLKNLA
jgi:hypothetical protein